VSGADPSVQAGSLQVTLSHLPGSRLPLLSARPVITFPAYRPVPNYTVWWQRHVYVSSLTKAVTWKWTGRDVKLRPFGLWANAPLLCHAAASVGDCMMMIAGVIAGVWEWRWPCRYISYLRVIVSTCVWLYDDDTAVMPGVWEWRWQWVGVTAGQPRYSDDTVQSTDVHQGRVPMDQVCRSSSLLRLLRLLRSDHCIPCRGFSSQHTQLHLHQSR